MLNSMFTRPNTTPRAPFLGISLPDVLKILRQIATLFIFMMLFQNGRLKQGPLTWPSFDRRASYAYGSIIIVLFYNLIVFLIFSINSVVPKILNSCLPPRVVIQAMEPFLLATWAAAAGFLYLQVLALLLRDNVSKILNPVSCWKICRYFNFLSHARIIVHCL